MIRMIASIFIMLAVSGCNSAYKRPATADVAQVRFLALQKKGWTSAVGVYAHKGDTCGGAAKLKHLGGGIAFGGRDLSDAEQGMLKDPDVVYAKGQYFETSVLSDSRLYFTAAGGEIGKLCFITASFVPTRGSQYEISYGTTFDECYVLVDRVETNAGIFKRLREPTAERRPSACTFFWN